ncbi:hypothetical protein BC937DRAFT_93352 [Endogone sp. FLAS-F59071]|nr:hypothetical protein BC937DRAFT_93352 [Endogone sp. FLAS-F59071]|eukprot:RUS21206.1 hypothetical protein BC937DRAFT_93352 [Endogone sp. FLAS-F59071]
MVSNHQQKKYASYKVSDNGREQSSDAQSSDAQSSSAPPASYAQATSFFGMAKGYISSLVSTSTNPPLAVTFHVILPYCDQDVYIPMVLGGISELGEWQPEQGVRLEHIRGDYWVSSTVLIPSSNTDVWYKYVLHNKADPTRSLWEGHSEHDDRKLAKNYTNVFDVWNDSKIYGINRANMKCAFIYGILQSLRPVPDTEELSQSDQYDIPSPAEFKDAVMMYQSLLKQQHELALASVSAEKIAQIVQEMPSHTYRLFVFILLGYSMENRMRNLPDTFPSGYLLSCLPQFDEGMLPSGTKVNLPRVVDALVLHNSQSGSYDWMIMFGLSEKFGLQWDSSVRPPHVGSHPDSFKEAFGEYVVPITATMELLEKVSTLKVVITWRFFVWLLVRVAACQQDLVLLYESETFGNLFKRDGIERGFLSRLSTILPKESPSPAVLLRTYQQLPKRLLSMCGDVYRERVLEMLTNPWKAPAELTAILASGDAGASGLTTDLLHSLFVLPEHADVFRKVFGRFATSVAPELKTLLPSLLQEFVFKLSDEELERMRGPLLGMVVDCKNWYKSLPQNLSVYLSLYTLSRIVPPPRVNAKLWPTDSIVDMGKERIRRANGEQLLMAAPQVGQLESIHVMKMFLELVRPTLKSVLDRTYSGFNRPTKQEAVPEYLAWICEKGKSLNIPNQ